MRSGYERQFFYSCINVINFTCNNTQKISIYIYIYIYIFIYQIDRKCV